MSREKKVISLFSGAGGMDLGFIKAGFKICLANDFDSNAVETYRYNIGEHIIEKNIKNLFVEEKEIKEYSDIDVVIGGPPCQGFSIAGKIGRTFKDDERNGLYREFVRIVSKIKPKYIVMENVAKLYTHNRGKTREEIVKDFSDIGYEVKVQILNSANYGTPQMRRRVFFIGKRINIEGEIKFPLSILTAEKYVNIEEAIGHFPKLYSGESSREYFNHESMNHTKQMLEKMSYVKDGCGRECIPKKFGVLKGDVRKYIRYNSLESSFCITGDMRKVFHYEQNRALTVRELAAIQDFPEDFKFIGTKSSQQQQVGNAVPVKLAFAVASCIKEMLNENKTVVKKFPKINYIGNKEKISEWIINFIPKDVKSIIDGFSGGASLSYKLKEKGYKVFSNDILKINFLLAQALIENDIIKIDEKDVEIIFSGIPFRGFISKNYNERYYFEEECMQLDLYRENIEKIKNKYKKAVCLILLRRAMIRKMPYSRFNIKWNKIKELRDEEYSYKKYGRKRAYHNQSFKEHFIENMNDYNDAIFQGEEKCFSYNEDIFTLLDKKIEADLIYLDPPYAGTLNDYYNFYGFIDTYINKENILEFENDFGNKKEITSLLEKLFFKCSNYRYCFLSYNEKAYPSKEILLKLLQKYFKKVKVEEKEHIYKITGKINKNLNKELLFICQN